MDLLKKIQVFFAYKLEQKGNASPHECTIWNGYGLSVYAEGHSAEVAMEAAIKKAMNGEWEGMKPLKKREDVRIETQPMRNVNGFDVCHNPERTDTRPGEDGADKEFLVFHPIYDGHYFLFGADTAEEADAWCNSQDFNEWSEKLL